MIKYLLYFVIKIITAILCYLTNPIVVLFCDEYGQLPKCFKLWQTYDNCLDIDWMIDEGIVPKIFRYDFHKHYVYHLEDKSSWPIKPGYVEIKDPNFTFKEKIQRYFCRLAWLYRNNGYGFSYYWLGRWIDYNQLYVIYNTNNKEVLQHYLGYINKQPGSGWERFIFNFLFTDWCFYYFKPYSKTKAIRLYFGWKFKFEENRPESWYCQYAFSINPFKSVD